MQLQVADLEPEYLILIIPAGVLIAVAGIIFVWLRKKNPPG